MTRRLVFLAVNASYAHSSLAAWRLQDYADPACWEWHTVEVAQSEPVPAVLESVLALEPAVLATTFYLFNRAWLESFLIRFRRLSPGTRVLGGGPEWLGDCASFFRPIPLVDAGVRGEGERAFCDWLNVWDRPSAWSAIPGVIGLDEAGRLRDSGESAEPPLLDSMPSPYARVCAGFRKPFIQIETSRGCGGACLFCTSAGRGVRLFPAGRVRDELRIIREAGIRDVRVLDRTFNDEEPRALEMLDLFRETAPDLRFHLELDPVRATPALATALGRFAPGHLHLEVGIQTLDGAAMRACGRRGSPDAVLDGLRRLRRVAGVAIHADLLAGLPGVTWERLVQDLGTLTAEGVDEIQLELLKLLPGTRLEAMAERLGLVAAPRPPYDLLRTPACSAADLWRAARLGRVVDGFYNAPPLRSLVRTASGRSAAFWPDLEAAVTAEGGIRGQWSLRKRFFLLKRFLTTRWPDLVPALVDAWYRRDDGIAPEVAPARLWRGPLPAEARFLEGSAGDWSRVVAVGEPPYRFYAFRVEPDGRHRLAAVAERT